MDRFKKQSPLEMLVAYQQAQASPTRAVPKDRFEKKDNIIIPIVEDSLPAIFDPHQEKTLIISNSNLTLNFNVNVDSKIINKALEKSKQVAKSLAAGAAMLGTAILLGGVGKKIPRVRVPLLPKPKIKKD